jgi:hypothetical protein
VVVVICFVVVVISFVVVVISFVVVVISLPRFGYFVNYFSFIIYL